MSKEIEHVQFVSPCQKDEKIVRHVAKNDNMSNGNIRHVAGVDGALVITTKLAATILGGGCLEEVFCRPSTAPVWCTCGVARGTGIVLLACVRTKSGH